MISIPGSPITKILRCVFPLVLLLNCKPGSDPDSIISFHSPQLFPEGITFDSNKNGFYVSSMSKGKVYFVDRKGNISQFISDPLWISTIGLKYDPERNRLLVCASDFGGGERSSEKTKLKTAYLSAYSTLTGSKIFTSPLGHLANGEKIFANDLVIDRDGIAFVTDSSGGKIFRVDLEGRPSLFLSKNASEKTSLNGILLINDSYLLVAHTSEGKIFKIARDGKSEPEEVSIREGLIGIDGMSLFADGKIGVVLNRQNKIMILESRDDWKSAAKVFERSGKDFDFPTTSTIADGKLYVLNAKLGSLMKNEKVSLFEILSFSP